MPNPSFKSHIARLSVLLEAFLSHGTATASPSDVLLIRRARGFALIGLSCLFLAGVVGTWIAGLHQITLVSCGMMVILAGSVGAGFIDNGRFIAPITHAGMASMLAGILGSGMHIGYVNPISCTFPILLVLSATYVLGVRSGFLWTIASIAGMGWTVFALALPISPEGAIPISRLGLFWTSALVLVGVYGLAAAERHFSDEARKELDFLARHDPLTGLLNRRALEEDLLEIWKRCQRYTRRFAVIAVDLDDFKGVNDAYGHGVGDDVLVEVARRISEMMRDTDRTCRLGGDEFLLVLEDVSEDKNVALTAERFITTLSAPVRIGELTITVGASLGVAVYPDAGTDPSTLMKVADLAMYEVKSVGGNAMWFDGSPELSSAPVGVTCVPTGLPN